MGQKMNIYKVWQNKVTEDGAFSSFIIVCKDEKTAKNTHPTGDALSEHTDGTNWPDNPADVSVLLLGKADKSIEAGIISTVFDRG